MTEHPLRYRGIDIPAEFKPFETDRFLAFKAGVDAVRDQEEALGAGYAALAAEEASGPRCRHCNADCSNGRSFDGNGLYACTACANARAQRYYTPAECGPALPEGTWLH